MKIARLLKECLIYKYPGSIEKVADLLGDTYNYVHAQTHERVNPHIKVIRAAFLVTGDQRFKRELEPDGWELVRKRQAQGKIKSMEGEAVDVVVATSDVIREIRKSIEDGKVTADELDNIECGLDRIESQVVELRAAVDHVRRKDAGRIVIK